MNTERMEQDNRELLKQNLELSDMLEEIVDILGFDKIKDLYIRQAKQARKDLDKLLQQPQRQDALNNQCRDVMRVANKMGCSKVADIILSRME